MVAKKKRASRHKYGSDFGRIDSHVITPEEYEEIPELTDEAFARLVLKKGARPVSANPRKQVTIRLPADVLARWKATGPGWQTRMADKLSSTK